MAKYTTQEIISYEEDDYVVTSVNNGIATLYSSTNLVDTVYLPAGDNINGSKKVTYNCYTTLNFSDIYHGRRLNNSDWRTATEDTRISALFWATDILNRQAWVGIPTTYSQALSWPRKWVPNRNFALKGRNLEINLLEQNTTLSESANYLKDTTVPPFLMDATAELALFLMKRSSSTQDEVSKYNDGLSKLSLGSIDLEFRKEDELMSDMPQQVYMLIRDFLSKVKEVDESVKVLGSAPLRRS
jgi:hypothetical protein